MSQRQASLQEVLTSAFDYSTANVYTSIPGIVVSVVSMDTLTVNVQPTINIRSEDNMVIAERPPILNVPVQMPISQEGGLTFPLQAGSLVMLVFSMRGLDAWKSSNGYPTTPLDMRKFDIRDCVAIPCIYPAGQSPNDPGKRTLSHNTQDVVLVHNIGTGNEVEIRLKSGGGVEINAPGQEVKVVCNEAIVEASSQATLDTPETLLTGNLTVMGTMAIEGEGGSGTSRITGNFNVVGSVLTHNGVRIGSDHVHTENGMGAETSTPH